MYFTILAWTKIIELFQPEEDKTGKQNFYVFIALMLIFLIANSFTLGGNYLLGKIFIGSTIAELFASWGIYLFYLENTKQKNQEVRRKTNEEWLN
jgi:hypothetical protein